MLVTGVTGPTRVDFEEEPSPETFLTLEAASNENFNESFLPTSKVVDTEREIVKGI